MAKKKTNYMAEKRFSLNDLLIGGCLLCGVFFFAVCLYAVNLYTSKAQNDSELINLNGSLDVINGDDLYSYYEEKINETASGMAYGDELYYTVLDINNDGLEELILKTGNEQTGLEFRFYTFDYECFENSEDVLIYAGSIGGNKTSALYRMTNEDFIMFISDSSYYVYLEDGMLSTFQVQSYEVPSRDNIIPFYDYTDLSLLN